MFQDGSIDTILTASVVRRWQTPPGEPRRKKDNLFSSPPQGLSGEVPRRARTATLSVASAQPAVYAYRADTPEGATSLKLFPADRADADRDVK